MSFMVDQNPPCQVWLFRSWMKKNNKYNNALFIFYYNFNNKYIIYITSKNLNNRLKIFYRLRSCGIDLK